MSVTNGCAEPGTYNPKLDKQPKYRSGMFQVFNSLANPFPKEINDPKEIKDVYKKYPIIPFAGSRESTGDSLIAFYDLLYSLSPTNGSCINKKSAFAFGSRPTASLAVDPDFDVGLEENDLSPQIKTAYRDTLYQYIIFDRPIRQFHRVLCTNYQKTGNAWIKLSIGNTLGQYRAAMAIKKQDHVRYLDRDGSAQVAISPIWTEEYLKKNPPDVVPIYPNFKVGAGGTMETMFHLKAGENDFYGRPESNQSDMSKYSEVQTTFYRIRSAYGEFTGKLILEAEAENPKAMLDESDTDARESGYLDEQHRFEDNFTQKSDDPQAVYVTYRPYGSRPMFVYSVPPNSNENFYKVIKGIDQDDIIRSHGCTLRFMAFDTPNGFSSDIFLDDYMLYVKPVIDDLRMTILGFVNKAITAVWEIVGKQAMNQYSLSFTSPVNDDLERYKERKNMVFLAQQNPDQNNQQQSQDKNKKQQGSQDNSEGDNQQNSDE